MILTRAPFRIPLGGGGTDLPFYAQARGGSLIAVAINLHIYVSLQPRLLDELIWLNYSQHEVETDVNEVKHGLIREALKMSGVTSAVEIHYMTELSEKAGVGGSGSFVVALLRALYELRGLSVFPDRLAKDAVTIERTILGLSGGVQDQYVAAYGGFCAIDNNSLTDVRVERLAVTPDVADALNRRLVLCYTGIQRSSADIINAQVDNHSPEDLIDFYDRIKDIGHIAKRALLDGDLDTLGKSFHEHWMLKREFVRTSASDNFDHIYDEAIHCGALGGKIIGAGGGGFFLFYVPDNQDGFSRKMNERGLIKVPFGFDYQGATTMVNSGGRRS